MDDTLTIPLYDHVFRPWRVVGDTRVSASDATWMEPHKWNEDFRPMRVLVDVDPFEVWHGPILNASGDRLYRTASAGSYVTEKLRGTGERRHSAGMADLRRDLFAPIDATPHLTWLLRTRFPENVRRMWPARDRHYSGPGWNQSTVDPNFRDNVWLGVQVEDQATADDRVPKLLACRDLASVLFVSAEPLVGSIDLSQFIWRKNERRGNGVIGTDRSTNVFCGPRRKYLEARDYEQRKQEIEAAGQDASGTREGRYDNTGRLSHGVLSSDVRQS